MNAVTVSRTLALIPERLPRSLTGSAFSDAEAAACKHPERIAHVMRFLGWLGPLNPLTKDDLRILGLLNQYGKPVGVQTAEDGADDEDTLASEEDLEPSLEPLFGEATLPPPAPPAP